MAEKFKIVTLGCRTNQYESQAYRDQLLKMGLSEAEEGEIADVCIVNTCTVTDSADQSSRYEIKQLGKKNPGSKIYVTGCLAQRESDRLQTLPQVEKVVSNLEKERLVNFLFENQDVPEFKIERFEAHTRAFVKVQDGCNSFCSYCIIPFVRGRSRSKTLQAVVDEVKGLVENGFKEVVLTGINIGDFDGGVEKGKKPIRLHQLVEAVDQIEGIKRVRISSIDPDEVDSDLIQAIKNGKNTAPSMHIVLQSGSNTVLKRMNRKYTKQQFFEAIQKLKEAHPDFTFTTDIIVGFPQETEEEFEETVEIVRHVEFAKVHLFPYSLRPGTKAARMGGHLPLTVIQERRAFLQREAEQAAFFLRERFVGKTVSVLFESQEDADSYIFGHTEHFLPVYVPQGKIKQNEIAFVQLLKNTPKGLIGEVILCN